MEASWNSYVKALLSLIRRYGFKSLMSPIGTLQEYRKWSRFQEKRSFIASLDYSTTDLLSNRDLMKRFSSMRNLKIETVNWFIPYFEHAFGGIHTILRFADYFSAKKGILNTLAIYGRSELSEENLKNRICRLFPSLQSASVIYLEKEKTDALPYADVCISTEWRSAYLLLKFNRTKGKFYFIQDYEPLFYPAGVEYALAEATYRFGFLGIANTPGLSEVYKQLYQGTAEYFIPSIDRNVFFCLEQKQSRPTPNPTKIFFYARPEIPRNAFELGILALEKIKKKYGADVEIYTAGSQWNPSHYGLKGVITNLGVLPYEETGKLYRECDIGIVFMLTKHPSYLPFELMACGCTVVTNRNPSTTWLLRDGENCIMTEPSITSIFEKIETCIENPVLRSQLAQNGLHMVGKTDWEKEIEKIYKFICRS